MSEPCVLVVHNRYRYRGGEERAVELQLKAMRRAGIEHAILARDSDDASKPHAAVAMVRGGDRPEEVGAVVRDLGASVVHVHNMHPLFGHRALVAAREAGAKVVLHLHNFRLFCAIGVAFRDGANCHRCRGRFTLPGIVLNCRGSLPEALVYGTALARYQPDVFGAVHSLAVPSEYGRAQLARLGAPSALMQVVPNYLPDSDFAEASRADRGEYALVAGRLSVEKGVETAISAAAQSKVPLKIAGDGPLADELRKHAARERAPVEFLGRLDAARLANARRGAAVALVPSRSGEMLPFAALEAMAAGVPVVGSRAGSLPEILGAERCVPIGDANALAAATRRLMDDPAARRGEGDALLADAHERFGEQRYVERLRALYAAAPR